MQAVSSHRNHVLSIFIVTAFLYYQNHLKCWRHALVRQSRQEIIKNTQHEYHRVFCKVNIMSDWCGKSMFMCVNKLQLPGKIFFTLHHENPSGGTLLKPSTIRNGRQANRAVASPLLRQIKLLLSLFFFIFMSLIVHFHSEEPHIIFRFSLPVTC